MEPSPTEVARGLYAALERGASGDDLAIHFTPDAVSTIHPSAVDPRGSLHDLQGMLAAAARGRTLLSRQTYEVRSAIERGATVVLRVTWTGVVAHGAGRLREGQVLRAHLAQFIETRGGRVAAIETYDCYEPIE